MAEEGLGGHFVSFLWSEVLLFSDPIFLLYILWRIAGKRPQMDLWVAALPRQLRYP